MWRPIIILLLLLSFIACKSDQEKNKENRLSFSAIKGITYYEVRRAFKNGVAFNDQGFQQEPEWAVRFLSDDSVQAYSPFKKRMLNFQLWYSHGKVYHFANEWFRILTLSKDSLYFQRLQVNGKEVANDITSNVYMTFYSDAYINKKTQTGIKKLREPNSKDSAFVQAKITMANKNPLDSSYFFAARNPVVFSPASKQINVEKVKNNNKLLNQSASYSYLYPEYRIKIKPAYKDFAYTIKAVVDKDSKIYVYDFFAMEEYRANRKKVLQGILDVYVSKLMDVKPGSTLGKSHASVITLHLKGEK